MLESDFLATNFLGIVEVDAIRTQFAHDQKFQAGWLISGFRNRMLGAI